MESVVDDLYLSINVILDFIHICHVIVDRTKELPLCYLVHDSVNEKGTGNQELAFMYSAETETETNVLMPILDLKNSSQLFSKCDFLINNR